MGCGMLATHIDSLFIPISKTDLKIVMSTTFTIIRMSVVRPLIGYVVDEVVDVDNEIIQQLIEWDCNVSSETYRAIIYCLTRQSVSKWHQLPIMWHV
jgi:superfamily II DNA helicase RecQ